jgi:hypothetical protein
MMTTATKGVNVVDIKDDDDSINEEQLSEYDEMLEELGSFPVRDVCIIIPSFNSILYLTS